MRKNSFCVLGEGSPVGLGERDRFDNVVVAVDTDRSHLLYRRSLYECDLGQIVRDTSERY